MLQTSNESQPSRLPEHIVRLISVVSQTDPRTVRRVVAGQPTRAMCRERVLRALRDHAQKEGDVQIGQSAVGLDKAVDDPV